jgi:hypothetical protein
MLLRRLIAVIGGGKTRFHTITPHGIEFLGHREPKIFIELPESRPRDPCTRVKAALLSALPRNCASSAALAPTPGIKFAHWIAQDGRMNPVF